MIYCQKHDVITNVASHFLPFVSRCSKRLLRRQLCTLTGDIVGKFIRMRIAILTWVGARKLILEENCQVYTHKNALYDPFMRKIDDLPPKMTIVRTVIKKSCCTRN